MRTASKTIAVCATTLSALAFFAVTAPAAQADEYCITNGAQDAHGCGYQSMEACRAAAIGIGGMCQQYASRSTDGASKTAGNGSPRNAFAYQPKRSGSRVRSNSAPKAPPANDQ